VQSLATTNKVLTVPELIDRDPEALSAGLVEWLIQSLGDGAQPEIVELQTPSSSGFSNETILATARWSQGDERAEHQLVLRLEPTRHQLLLDDDFTLQYRVMQALQAQSSVPVPRLRRFIEDPSFLGAPFFVMAHVDGRVPSDDPPYGVEGWLQEATKQEQATLWWSGIETLAAIHQLDWKGLGLGFLADDPYGAAGLERNLNYYRAFLEWATEDRPQPMAEATWDWLTANRPEEPGDPVLSWGDSRIGNIIWKDFRPQAVLDWKMASLGPPELDLGWWLYFDRMLTEGLGVERPSGFPTHDETIARYELLIGREVQDLHWYQIFAGFRAAVITCRVAKLLMGSGIRSVGSDFESDDLPIQFTAKLLGLPSPEAMSSQGRR
jgi:aminoglycoside phosphotransferase (APT) family kinase protein